MKEWKPTKDLQQIEQRIKRIEDCALEIIKRKIQRYCDKHGYSFKCLYSVRVLDQDGNDVSPVPSPVSLVFWFEDCFRHNFPQCMYENGEWNGI